VKPSVLLIILLGLMTSLAHAQEPSACTAACTAEKEQCTARASKLSELDKAPKLEEANPFARTADRNSSAWSDSARSTDRLASQRRGKERLDACTANFKRCSSACTPAVAPAREQVAPAKWTASRAVRETGAVRRLDPSVPTLDG